MERLDIINDILGGSATRLRETYFINNYPDVYSDIISYTDFIKDISFKERIWYWVNNQQTPITCLCGKSTTFNKNWQAGYRKFCSTKCAQTDETKEKRRKTNIERYGVDNVAKNEDIKRKTEQTNIEKWGFKSTFQNKEVRDKWKNTIRDKWGVDHYFMTTEFREKTKEYFISKYGEDTYTKTEEYLERVKQTNKSKWGTEWFTQSDEYKTKVTESNREKWGVDWFTQSDEYKTKVTESNREKWGVDWFIQSEEHKQKTKQTNLDKRGVEHHTKSDKYHEQIIQRNKELYGKEWFYQTDEFKNKNKETQIEKYGVEHYSKTNEWKDRVKSTNMEKWGVDNPMRLEEFKNKVRITNLEKWGVDNIQKQNDYRKKFGITNHPNYIEYVSDGVSRFKCDKGHEHTFDIRCDNYIKRYKSNNPLCTVCYPISMNKSLKELELFEFISSIYGGEIIQSYRDGLEIDIYLPELKIGFEFNGIYWHSEKFLSKNYHLDKTIHFINKEIRIIHIWEDDWDNRRSIILSQIRYILGIIDNKIYARKCEVHIIDNKMASLFLDQNHIQGSVNSVISLGLLYNEQLVAVMSFDHFEGRKRMSDDEWNLNRFCSLINYTIIGGASKLLNYFVSKYNPKRVISYADRNWSVGGIYDKLNFRIVSYSRPDYKYIIEGERVHKSRFKKIRSIYGLSESEFVSKSGIDKVWDCGKIKFEKLY